MRQIGAPPVSPEDLLFPEPIFRSKDEIVDPQKRQRAIEAAFHRVIQMAPNVWSSLDQQERKTVESLVDHERLEMKGKLPPLETMQHRFLAERRIHQRVFKEISDMFDMNFVPAFNPSAAGNKSKAAMILTESASMLALQMVGDDGTRQTQYSRTPSRKENWKGPVSFSSSPGNISVGTRVRFPEQFTTSPIAQIAVAPDKLMLPAEGKPTFNEVVRHVREGLTHVSILSRR